MQSDWGYIPYPFPLTTRVTVMEDTPASLATSFLSTILPLFHPPAVLYVGSVYVHENIITPDRPDVNLFFKIFFKETDPFKVLLLFPPQISSTGPSYLFPD